MIAVAVGSAAVAAVLWLRPATRTAVGPPASRLPDGAAWALGFAGTAAAVGSLPARAVALVALAGLTAAAAARLWGRRRRRLEATREAGRVLECCEQLAAELGSGQPPGTALQRVATEWAVLTPAAEAFALGADVPAVLREVACRPGAGDLRVLAAGWQVAHRTGSGLAAAVGSIAIALREAESTRRLVAGELASARATARLVALLPFLALAMGSGAGGDPWRFLLATPPGLACLAGGLALGLAGLWWIEVLTGDPG